VPGVLDAPLGEHHAGEELDDEHQPRSGCRSPCKHVSKRGWSAVCPVGPRPVGSGERRNVRGCGPGFLPARSSGRRPAARRALLGRARWRARIHRRAHPAEAWDGGRTPTHALARQPSAVSRQPPSKPGRSAVPIGEQSEADIPYDEVPEFVDVVPGCRSGVSVG
jgi:hypothetical protein